MIFPGLSKIAKCLWLTLTVILAALMVVSANGALVSPKVSILPSLLAMVFPMFVLANAVAAALNLFLRRRFAMVQLAAALLSVNALASFCPVNYPRKADSELPVLKLMTYNALNFDDVNDCYPDGTNRSLSQVINSGADFVAVQEIQPMVSQERHITPAQMDSLNKMYPYQILNTVNYVSIYSKYPADRVEMPVVGYKGDGWVGAEVAVGADTLLIVNVHLTPFKLSDSDKKAYLGFTEGERGENWKGEAKTLYQKVARSFISRRAQINTITHQIDSLGYKNVIVCGDFNDVPNSHAVRLMARGKMRSAFATAAFGPMITYYYNRFYFLIDHILYEGGISPLSLTRGSVKSSDHYPLYFTFQLR